MRNYIVRICIYTICGIVLLGGILSYIVYSKYLKVEKENPAVRNTAVNAIPSKQVTLGQPVVFEYKFDVPWNKTPEGVKIEPGQGCQVAGNAEIFKERTCWGFKKWIVRFNLQPFSTGEIPAGKAFFYFTPETPAGTNSMALEIPSFKSLEIANLKDELNIASKLDVVAKTNRTVWVYALIIIVAVVIVVLYFLFKRKKEAGQMPLTPWAKALVNLTGLNNDFSHGNVGVVACVARLTDIVREYLEERFSIHAPRQTTVEFLRSMENSDSPLSNKDRNFLKDFMTSADMIKFAKYEAEKELVVTSMDRASQLVTETIPVAAATDDNQKK